MPIRNSHFANVVLRENGKPTESRLGKVEVLRDLDVKSDREKTRLVFRKRKEAFERRTMFGADLFGKLFLNGGKDCRIFGGLKGQ